MKSRSWSIDGLRILTTALLLATWSACGTDNTDTTTSSSLDSAELGLVASVDPVVALPSPNADYQWLAPFTVALSESGGVAATIQAVQATLSEASGGIIVIGAEDEEVQVSFTSSTNSLPANGAVTLTFNIYYTLPGGGREAVIDLVVQVLDDNGYTVQDTLRVNVN